MKSYAKVIVKGSPISKSNFKLFNLHGRAILPYNSGKYHDRYAIYEEEISYAARSQNPGIVLDEALIAVLRVYYKSSKRHPDTNNITKSIFDGIEKSGLIVNDAQIRRLIIEEFYDKENPRFEMELYGESNYEIQYGIIEKTTPSEPITYSLPPNRRSAIPKKPCETAKHSGPRCEICGNLIDKNNMISANKGSTLICRDCLKKLF